MKRIGNSVLHFATVTVAASVCLAANLFGQSFMVARNSSEAKMIAAAEAEGARFQQVAPTHGMVAAPRRCVVAYEMGPVSSGEFTIGGKLGGSVAMRAGAQGKVWWSPLHNSADMPPLVVRGRSLTTPTDTMRFTTDRIAWPVVPGALQLAQPKRKYFFPSGITIPRPGGWLLIATSGANWGCFIVTTVSH
jgi:hypothetical protein